MSKYILMIVVLACNTTYGQIYIGGPLRHNSLDSEEFQLLKLSETEKVINIYINSGGGYVQVDRDFVKIMKKVQNRGVTIACYSQGLTMSAAFYIFSHCDRRYVRPNSILMIHDPYYSGLGDTIWKYKDSLVHVESVRKFRKAILSNFKVSERQYEWLSDRDYNIEGVQIYLYDEKFIDGVEVGGNIMCSNKYSCLDFVSGYISGRKSVNPIFNYEVMKLYILPKTYPAK